MDNQKPQVQWVVTRILHSAPPANEQFVIKIGMPEQVSKGKWRCPYYASLEKPDSKGEVLYTYCDYAMAALFYAIAKIRKGMDESGLNLTWLGEGVDYGVECFGYGREGFTQELEQRIDEEIENFITELKLKAEGTSVPSPELDLVKTFGILNSVAEKYPAASDEYEATELAAEAIWFIYITAKTTAFQEYLKNSDRELTKEQEKILHDFGLEP